VHHGNDSYWLTNPDESLEGDARTMGNERSEPTLRTRIGLVMVEDRAGGADDYTDVHPDRWTREILELAVTRLTSGVEAGDGDVDDAPGPGQHGRDRADEARRGSGGKGPNADDTTRVLGVATSTSLPATGGGLALFSLVAFGSAGALTRRRS
jgi:hypothetical protein